VRLAAGFHSQKTACSCRKSNRYHLGREHQFTKKFYTSSATTDDDDDDNDNNNNNYHNYMEHAVA
jgi:hypothetical protein